ncbi:MAG: helix-turn-helix domain-containing protein [Sedimentisphaerales bacterium]|nr:helix-turn-helix domain-containing protein [Sedimentisphaerales bacterium]
MAGMFYSLEEAAEKLGKTEDEVKQLAKSGQLREFRDGSNLLFKIDEVNALLAETPAPEVAAEPEAEPDVDLGLDFEPEPSEVDMSMEPELEPESEPDLDFDLTGSGEPAEEDLPLELDEAESPDVEMPAAADATAALNLAPDADEGGTAEFVPDELLAGMEESEEEPVAELGDDEDISLAPETGIMAGGDITDMDTALTGQGINVLGDSDAEDYGVTDDSLAETVGPAGASTEASLEEIEDDVNLDSFGSGSGLLDLSLQADDTSLGGILDEIYTADGGEEEPAAAAPGSLEDLTAEAEHVGHEDELAVPEPMVAAPMAVGAAYVEAPPDTQSNMLGFLLFIPLLALLYTAIVVWSGQKHVMPTILESIQGFILYIVGAGAVLTLIIFGASFVVGGEKAPRAARAAKEKKSKAAPKDKKAKAKKEKAPKAEKPAKGAKPKKSISLFAKKKR